MHQAVQPPTGSSHRLFPRNPINLIREIVGFAFENQLRLDARSMHALQELRFASFEFRVSSFEFRVFKCIQLAEPPGNISVEFYHLLHVTFKSLSMEFAKDAMK